MLVASRVTIKVRQTVELLADEKGVKTIDEMVARTVVSMASAMVVQKATKIAEKMEYLKVVVQADSEFESSCSDFKSAID